MERDTLFIRMTSSDMDRSAREDFDEGTDSHDLDRCLLNQYLKRLLLKRIIADKKGMENTIWFQDFTLHI